MTDHFAESPALISERNISFSGRNLSSDTGAMLPLDFIQCNHLLDPYKTLSYSDKRSSYAPHNSSHSLLTQLVFRFLCGYFPQADQEVLRKDPLLSRYFAGVSSVFCFPLFQQNYRRDQQSVLEAVPGSGLWFCGQEPG